MRSLKIKLDVTRDMCKTEIAEIVVGAYAFTQLTQVLALNRCMTVYVSYIQSVLQYIWYLGVARGFSSCEPHKCCRNTCDHTESHTKISFEKEPKITSNVFKL